MNKKIKHYTVDFSVGLSIMLINILFIKLIYFDFKLSFFILSISFFLTGIYRGRIKAGPLLFRILIIHLFGIIFIIIFIIKGIDSHKFIIFPITNIIFTIIGFLIVKLFMIRKKYISYISVFSIVLIGGVSILFIPNYLTWMNSTNKKIQLDNFIFTNLQGDTLCFDNDNNKVLLIDFWSISCGKCRYTLPIIEKLYYNYRKTNEIQVYIVNSGFEPIEKVQNFIKKKNIKVPCLYDKNSKIFKAWGLQGEPSIVLIDKLSIKYVHCGYRKEENLYNSLDRKIKKLLLIK